MDMNKKKRIILLGSAAGAAILLFAAWSLWFSPTRIGFVNYQTINLGEISKANAKLEATIAKNDTQKSIVAMAELRKLVDSLEVEVDDVLWPLPKYSELLFVY